MATHHAKRCEPALTETLETLYHAGITGPPLLLSKAPAMSMNKLQRVVWCKIEFETPRRYALFCKKPWTHGRVYLWVKLECGHCVQRVRAKRKDDSYTEPKCLKCESCVAEGS